MKIPQAATNTASGLFVPMAAVFLQDTFRTMLPWIMVMLSVVLCDLIAGIRKSLKLGIHVSWSMAFRETMGKMVTYVAFVMMVAMIDAASGHSYNVALWGCLFICALEGGSILSNILKPYGIDITPKGIVLFFSSRLLHTSDAESSMLVDDAGLEHIRERERGRWEKRQHHRYGSNTQEPQQSIKHSKKD